MTTQRNPHALLSPAMREVLERMHRVQRVPMQAMNAEQARAAYAAAANVLEPPVQKIARVQDIALPVRDGSRIAARVYADAPGELPVLVYFHGGGFVVGSLDTHDGLCRRLAHLAGCAVVSVDYRLAPRYRFPTAFEDAWDSVLAVRALGAQWALDTTRMAVGGDSAGGTLAAACAIAARDAGVPLALQLLLYPGLMGQQNSASHHLFGKGFLLDADLVGYFFGQYLRSPADRADWRFAPLDGVGDDGMEVDVAGVAPVWMGLAECDPLVDEGLAYADKLRMAGVAVELEIYRGVVHEFMKMGRAISTAQQAHQEAARALQQALGLKAQ